MFEPSTHRFWQGIVIQGDQIALELLPSCHEARVAVTPCALAALTGRERGARLAPDELPNSYLAADIAVHHTELRCLAADAEFPCYRQGFTLTLEPGMAPLLRQWLPRLFDVARVATDIAGLVDAQLRAGLTPLYLQHLYGLVACVAAGVVLDGEAPPEALARERAYAQRVPQPWSGTAAAPLWAALDSEEVQARLSADPGAVQPGHAPTATA